MLLKWNNISDMKTNLQSIYDEPMTFVNLLLFGPLRTNGLLGASVKYICHRLLNLLKVVLGKLCIPGGWEFLKSTSVDSVKMGALKSL